MSTGNVGEWKPALYNKGWFICHIWKHGEGFTLPAPEGPKSRADFPFRTTWAVIPGGGVLSVQQCCAWSKEETHAVEPGEWFRKEVNWHVHRGVVNAFCENVFLGKASDGEMWRLILLLAPGADVGY